MEPDNYKKKAGQKVIKVVNKTPVANGYRDKMLFNAAVHYSLYWMPKEIALLAPRWKLVKLIDVPAIDKQVRIFFFMCT